jgi:hypothetical protein
LFNGRIFRHMPTILPDVRDAALRQAQGAFPKGSGRSAARNFGAAAPLVR